MTENFDERSLPVSIDTQTKEFITANDIKNKTKEGADFTPLENLNEELVEKIVIERIRKAPELQLVVLRGSAISKDRAVKEVLSKTPIGEDIMEIERRAIKMTLKNING